MPNPFGKGSNVRRWLMVVFGYGLYLTLISAIALFGIITGLFFFILPDPSLPAADIGRGMILLSLAVLLMGFYLGYGNFKEALRNTNNKEEDI